MPSYRIFRIGGDGRISAADVVEAESDAAAVAAAQDRAGLSEVWLGGRLVARVNGGGRTSKL